MQRLKFRLGDSEGLQPGLEGIIYEATGANFILAKIRSARIANP